MLLLLLPEVVVLVKDDAELLPSSELDILRCGTGIRTLDDQTKVSLSLKKIASATFELEKKFPNFAVRKKNTETLEVNRNTWEQLNGDNFAVTVSVRADRESRED